MDSKTVAVMQPYLFPYLGYFQLIQASDIFVFYDDVDFITRGWINRNRIIVNGEPHLFTVPCRNASQNSLIKDVNISNHWRPKKLIKKIRLSYSNASHFDNFFSVTESVFSQDTDSISELAIESVRKTCHDLGIETRFQISSELPIDNKLDRADRLIALTKHFDSKSYINMEGGQDLYEKTYFASQGVDLRFLKPNLPEYSHHNASDFESGLSIIDVMMNMPRDEVRSMLQTYQLT